MIILLMSFHGDAVVSTIVKQKKGPGFKSRPGPFCMEFCMLSPCMREFLKGTQLPPTVPKHTC